MEKSGKESGWLRAHFNFRDFLELHNTTTPQMYANIIVIFFYFFYIESIILSRSNYQRLRALGNFSYNLQGKKTP